MAGIERLVNYNRDEYQAEIDCMDERFRDQILVLDVREEAMFFSLDGKWKINHVPFGADISDVLQAPFQTTEIKYLNKVSHTKFLISRCI